MTSTVKSNSLLYAEDSALLVIDMQQRLLPHVHDWQRVLEHVDWLLRLAQRIGVPVAATEQYPRGIGPTHQMLSANLPAASIAEKLHFSCVAADCLAGLPGMDKPQLVVAGIEAHVCVLQTVLQLLEAGRQVFVVAEAISSRDPQHKALALERMRSHGATIVCREMVAFEWLGQAGTPLFREISKQFIQQ